MKVFTIQIPEPLHSRLVQLAERDGVSVDQLVTAAVVEKVSASLTVDYLREHGEGASRDEFEAILSKVPRVEPEEHDRL